MSGGVRQPTPLSDRIEKTATRSSSYVVALAVVPLVVLTALGARVEWLWRGALAWGVAFIAKLPLMGTLGLGATTMPAWLYGVCAALISAGTELGFALLVLTRAAAAPSLADILLFAAAAGSAEALVIVAWTLFVPTPNADKARWLKAAAHSRIVRHQFLLERSIAWFGHVGSRSLLALAFVRRVPALGIVAVLTFAVTDGLAAYEHQRQADWFSSVTLSRYFRVAIAAVAVELAVLVAYLALS